MEEMKMRSEKKMIQVDRLLILLIVYCAASLFHFVHNAVFIDEYPNLPGWISAVGVYITWFGITGIGIVGYLLLRRGHWCIGFVTVAVYGALGLDGLGHYSLAPLLAHTFTMNLTIWLEAITAVLVLIAVTGLMVRQLRGRSETV